MGRQLVMCVVRNEMMAFTRSRGRINVDRSIGKVRQMVQELMANFSSNLMTLLN
jgi:DNA-directed RNA polymerase specialized sigma subunit